MSRVYEIEVLDTAFYREGDVDRFRVLQQQGVDRYEVTISLGGRDVRYVSTVTYWVPSQATTATGHGYAAGWYESGYGQEGSGVGAPQTVARTWRNPNCSLTIWTSKVVTVPVEIWLKNGQIVRVLHRLTFNDDFRSRVLRPQDVMHHNNGTVSYGVRDRTYGRASTPNANAPQTSVGATPRTASQSLHSKTLEASG